MPVKKTTFEEMVNKAVKPFPKKAQATIREVLEQARPKVETEIKNWTLKKTKQQKELSPLEKVRYCQARPQPLTHPRRPYFLNNVESRLQAGYTLTSEQATTLDEIYNEVLRGD